MIKIHDNLWYIIKPEDKDNLAYMCQYEENKDGEPLSNVARMQETGRGWANQYIRNWKYNVDGSIVYDEHKRCVIESEYWLKGEEFTVDNTPTSGFYVGCSVSRWSTSNKLFRVKDPRGFTVEIPTDNLATLLHHTTVVKGFVNESCVWGREGNNHILLPVNSEPYLITLDQMDTLENKLIPLKDLKVGDWVRFFAEPDTEYYYLGKIKATWKIRGYWYEGGGYWNRDERKTHYTEWEEVVDNKWVSVFLHKHSWSKDDDKWCTDTTTKPKIIEVLRNEPMDVAVENISMYRPQRVLNQSQHAHHYAVEASLVSYEVK